MPYLYPSFSGAFWAQKSAKSPQIIFHTYITLVTTILSTYNLQIFYTNLIILSILVVLLLFPLHYIASLGSTSEFVGSHPATFPTCLHTGSHHHFHWVSPTTFQPHRDLFKIHFNYFFNLFCCKGMFFCFEC